MTFDDDFTLDARVIIERDGCAPQSMGIGDFFDDMSIVEDGLIAEILNDLELHGEANSGHAGFLRVSTL